MEGNFEQPGTLKSDFQIGSETTNNSNFTYILARLLDFKIRATL